ncbi:F-box only protein 40 [Electrophorus electricus]|uniref:F-box only protein 40 n=1 Tax=Electrophorus electricus TaxID=8005 RepID=UPI0015CFD927|nr:F-box only protein 40 [Electrophorus electricus]
MSRYRRTAPRLHRHCESCYSRHCRAPPEVSVSCMLINCRLLCGASFHMCKESEHTLLCPNEKVPCLNSCYGCPFTMSRSRLAKHLEVCPASVVCCSVEWNRWPTEDIKSPLNINLMKETHGQQSLDLSMALRDQKHLCGRLKMRSLFPELMEEPEVPIPSETDEAVGWEVNVNGESADSMGDETFINSPLIAAKEEHVEKGSQNLIVNKEKYDLFEKMFSMERGGCLQVQKASSKTGEKKDKNTQSKGSKNPAVSEQEESSMEPVKVGQRGDTIQPDISKTGLAPWQEGVLERLGQEVNPREYNMYIVHHGRMLLTFGQIEACTPREKDFVYGSLEPIPVQTLRSFNVPTSYKHKRIQLKDPSNQALTKHKSVDTSDLGVPEEDMQKMDEMFATLLCSAELEIRGHKISEKVATDGLYIDIATQTYNFSMAPFKYNSTLADITTERDLMLYLQMDTEIVTLRHNKNTSAFTFLCGHFFRRDEFASHFKNVHSDIQSCLNGWFEERCPLSYLGCTFSQRRLQPSTHRATVSYNQDLSIFTLSPEITTSLLNDSQMVPTQNSTVRCEDCLSNLPFEVLRHIARYLDSFSLSQLSLVSRLFREVSATLLQERGMVGLKWRKKFYSHGRARWKSSIVWEFSSLFSRVNSWCFGDTPPMAEHLKHCPYYQMEPKTKPFALTSMQESKSSQKQQSLMTLFKGRR